MKQQLLLHVGIDPATKLLGVSIITHEGTALRPLEGFEGKILSPHQTLSGGSKPDVHVRLSILEEKLLTYFNNINSFVHGIYGTIEWRIASIGIEKPAMNTYVQKGGDGKTQNRFDTTFALGRAFQKAMDAAHAVSTLHGYDIAIYELLPSDSSMALGLSTFATKKARNRRCAQLEGGTLIETDERKSDNDWVKGGNLHNAGPDALDAYAAATAARKRYIDDMLSIQANNQAKESRRETAKPSSRKRRAA